MCNYKQLNEKERHFDVRLYIYLNTTDKIFVDMRSDQQIPTFIISLPEATKRRDFMKLQMQKYKLQYDFFESSRFADFSKDFLKKFDKNFDTHGDLGCTLSHYILLQKIIKDKIPIAMVLEDDAVITQNLVNAMFRLPKILSDFDIVQLGYSTTSPKRTPTLIYNTIYPLSIHMSQKIYLGKSVFHVGLFNSLVYCTHAYLVTNEGAIRISRLMRKFQIKPFDVFLHDQRERLKRYGVAPHLSKQDYTHNLEQYINPERVKNKFIKLPEKKVSPMPSNETQNIFLERLYKNTRTIQKIYRLIRCFPTSVRKTIIVCRKPLIRKD